MGSAVLRLFQSKAYKRITIVFGLLFFVFTIVLSFDPKPFLQYGYIGIFIFSLVGPVTFLVPTLAQHMNVIGLACVASLGMAGNDSVSWLVGRSGDVIVPRSSRVVKIEKTMRTYGSFALFFWSLIPFPYDIIGLIAGYLEFSYCRFVIPTFFGRFIRFILMGSGIVAVLGVTSQ